MNSQIIRDELDALASIFCGDGEFQVVASDEKEVAILVTPFSLGGKHVMLSVMLHSAKYPEEVPKFSVQVPYRFLTSNYLYSFNISLVYRAMNWNDMNYLWSKQTWKKKQKSLKGNPWY